ncbi:MAG TPA: GNAT family N-acetyltransferase [Thermomicrobiales bacterium]|nr:GNAT family N-acetyltransferase [Thermomicrobiales bacterium]
MSIVERQYTDADFPRVLTLLGACRRAGYVDMELLSTNLRLTLTDPAFDYRHTLLQERSGSLDAFALLWQGRYLAMLVAPNMRGRRETGVLVWAEHQMIAIGDHARLAVLCRDDDALMVRFCETHGFALDDEELRMGRLLDDSLPIVAAPPGIVIRPLRGTTELEDWLALYTEAFGPRIAQLRRWRAMRDDPDHEPSLDLIAAQRDGTLVGMCYCSIASFEASNDTVVDGRTEPIAIRHAFQRQGLGRALVSAGLTALRTAGAGVATLTTEVDNIAAHRFYATLGYRELYRARWYGRDLQR